jgi:phosphate transport system substrate-binding protein
MKVKTLAIAAAATVALSSAALAQSQRDGVWSVGSSTVFPYSQAVAEEFSALGNPSPSIESTGTGGGMRLFCGGIGLQYPDITRASRAMKQSEWDNCQENGIESITEIQVGSDGISFAVSRNGTAFDVSRAQLFLALAADVPVDGAIVPNPYTNWSEIDASLPDVEITVYGPPPTSGTRDAWVELVMEEGCEAFAEIEALHETDEDRAEQVCQRMRTDGHFIEAGENDNLIVQTLNNNTSAYGIFGYSFLYENQDALMPVTVEGASPSLETIGDGSYPVARPLFIYVKNAHRGVTPGLQEYVELYTDEDTFGPDGFLVERGLVSLSDEDRERTREEATNGTVMTRFASN